MNKNIAENIQNDQITDELIAKPGTANNEDLTSIRK